MTRDDITLEQFDQALALLRPALLKAIAKHGLGGCSSSHEIMGILQEEFDEFKLEVHKNRAKNRKIAELVDIAVGAVFGIASLQTGAAQY